MESETVGAGACIPDCHGTPLHMDGAARHAVDNKHPRAYHGHPDGDAVFITAMQLSADHDHTRHRRGHAFR